MSGTWHNLSEHQRGHIPSGRSSHSVVALGGSRVAVFGGESGPRQPIDDTVHLLELASGEWSSAAAASPAPAARVGHAAASVSNRFYIFGGRTGVDQQQTSLGDLWVFDAHTLSWRSIETGEGGPAARSYHVMASHGSCVYLFGGCGAMGRLNDLYVFDTEQEKWEQLHPAAGSQQPSPRGGPALFATADKVYVFGGFDGKEINDFWAYDLATHRWETMADQGNRPTARSVTAFGVLDHHRLFIFGGEVDPSEQGHAGAGVFVNETFVFDTSTLTWTKHTPQTNGEAASQPSARGWLAGTGLGDGRFVLFGGFDGKNRVADLFLWT